MNLHFKWKEDYEQGEGAWQEMEEVGCDKHSKEIEEMIISGITDGYISLDSLSMAHTNNPCTACAEFHE